MIHSQVPKMRNFADVEVWKFAEDVRAFLQSIRPSDSPDIYYQTLENGTIARLRRPQRPSRDGRDGLDAEPRTYPFQVYQHTPSPSVPASDWRTLRIRAGALQGVHPDNDDSQASPLTIVVPENTTNYVIWLDATVGVNDGSITAVTIAHGAAGWSGYPNQPSPAASGEVPNKLYIEIALITTGDDDDIPKSLSIAQTTQTSLGAGMQTVSFNCGSSNPWTYRMAWWRA